MGPEAVPRETQLQRCASPQARHIIEKSVHKIVSLLTASEAVGQRLLSERAPLTEHQCYQEAVTHFRTHCFNWHSSTVSLGRSRRPKARFTLWAGRHPGFIAWREGASWLRPSGGDERVVHSQSPEAQVALRVSLKWLLLTLLLPTCLLPAGLF